MKLSCPNCGAPIPADKINIQETLAVCPRCDTVFRFDKEAVRTIARRKGRKLRKPDPFDVREDEDGVQIRFRTIRNLNALTVFVGVLFTFLTLFFGAVGIEILGEGETITTILGAFFLLVSFATLYLLASIGLNTTSITLDEDNLSHLEEPIYAFDNHTIPRYEINRVEVRPVSNDGSMSGYSHLVAILHDGTEQRFASNYKSDQARYIAHVLEEYLLAAGPYADALDSSRLDVEASDLSADASDTEGSEQQTAKH